MKPCRKTNLKNLFLLSFFKNVGHLWGYNGEFIECYEEKSRSKISFKAFSPHTLLNTFNYLLTNFKNIFILKRHRIFKINKNIVLSNFQQKLIVII